MSIGCTYIWQGKKYSKDRILRAILLESGSQFYEQDQSDSINWLMDKIGIDKSQVRIVSGLIANKSLGRFLQDGRILLSGFADSKIAYHEGFHRVWRMSLTPNERKQSVESFKKRKNWQELIEPYKSIYPANTEQELIEEYLADEFSDFVVNPDTFKIEQPIKSYFERIWDFIKKMLGLSSTDITQLYNDINNGKYKNKIQPENLQYRKSSYADAIKINDIALSVEDKQFLVREATRQFIQDISQKNPILLQDIIKGNVKINPAFYFFGNEGTIAKMIKTFLTGVDLQNTSAENLNAPTKVLITELAKGRQNPESSYLFNEVKKQLTLLGINEVDTVLEDNNNTDKREEGQKDDGGFTTQIELDPKSNMSTQIKILLGSFYDETKKNKYGFHEPISWTKAFISIAESMSGVPTQVFMEELLRKDLPFKEQLRNLFSNTSDMKWLQFRNDFISNLSRTVNNFNIMNVSKDSIYFFNANENTRAKRIERDWQNQFVKAMSVTGDVSVGLLKDKVRTVLNNSRDIFGEFERQFDIKIHPDLQKDNDVFDKLINILNAIDRNKTFNETNKPDVNKLFKEFDVQGNIQAITDALARYEDAVDLMVFAMSKKIYGLGLNNQVTLMANKINYVISRFTPDMTKQERMQLLSEYVPHLNTAFFLDPTFYEGEFEETKVRSKWLLNILEGIPLKVNIVYNGKNDTGDETETSDMDEPDLLAMHLNSSLQGVTMSLKHSDRSIFYAYSFGNQPMVNPFPDNPGGLKDRSSVIDYLTKYMTEQIEHEVAYSREYQNSKQGFQYFDNAINKPALGELLPKGRFEALLKGDSINQSDIASIKKGIESGLEVYERELEDWGVLSKVSDGLRGLNKESLAKYGSVELAVATAYANELLNHVEESKFVAGDLRFFKNPTDLFKRLAATSSTGQVLVNDTFTNLKIRQEVSKNRFTLVNPKTGEVTENFEYPLAPDGKLRAVTYAEEENYVSHLLKPATSKSGTPLISKLTGKQESVIFMTYEYNLMNDPRLKDLSKEELENKIRKYESKYKTANENDGQSWMNIFAFKNYMIRLGNWTDGMEMVFQTELKALSAKSFEELADIEIDIMDSNGTPVKFKPFEIPEGENFDSRKVDGVKLPVKMEAFHTLKTQYSGFSVSEQYAQAVNDFRFMALTVLKTSQHILMPSAVVGTNLQTANHMMLKNGQDILHMGSANKVGGVDPKVAAKNNSHIDSEHIRSVAEKGLTFYTEDGHFNDEPINNHSDIFSYLIDVDFLKDQVRIGNKVKSSIKGSTQSLKLMLSNLITQDGARFEGADNIIRQYKEIISNIINQKGQNLIHELNFNSENRSFEDDRKKLENVLLDSQAAKSAPENVINALYNFISNPVFESLPNKTKIENILYSLITNRVVSFNRPGNSYPQAANTGYETIGSRKLVDGTIQANQDTVKFYDVIFNEDGSIEKVDPAEVIIPLPKSWIEPVLKLTGTRNLVKAVSILNKMIADGELNTELTFKGLRIPNQQLSSNDVFKIKKFHLPTSQNYAIVPTELVTKVGSD